MPIERSFESDIRLRIVLPPDRIAAVEFEAESATCTGGSRQRNADAVSIFTLGAFCDEWSDVVLAVADGRGWSDRGDQASAAAVAAIKDHLTDSADRLHLQSAGWQGPVARALNAAFEHANAAVRSLPGRQGAEPEQGVALTVAALLGNWLCVAHAGDCRAYRRSKRELSQLTADDGRRSRDQSGRRRVRALGLEAQLRPAIRFFHLQPGDTVLVCSDGLCRSLAGPYIARLIGARRPLAQIAGSLVTAAAARGGEDDISACLARVGPLPARRLPNPTEPVDPEQADEAVTLPRYRVRTVLPSNLPRTGLVLGCLTIAVALFGGWRFRQVGLQVEAPVALVLTASAPQYPVFTPGPPAVESVVVPPGTPPAATVPPAALPARHRSPRVVPAAGLLQDRDSVQRQLRDSTAAENQRAADWHAGDSLRAAQLAEAAELAERERRAAATRAEQLATAGAARAARVRQDRQLAGETALGAWLNGVVSETNARRLRAPVLAAGPAGFVSFVDGHRPKLSEARLLAVTMGEASGAATAAWVAEWRTAFGPVTSRRMQATATVVLEGNDWRLQEWRITEGAP